MRGRARFMGVRAPAQESLYNANPLEGGCSVRSPKGHQLSTCLPAWKTSSHRGISASRSPMRLVCDPASAMADALGPRAAGHRQESIHCHRQRGRRRALARRGRREHGDGEGSHAQRAERRGARTVEPGLLEPRVGRVGNRRQRHRQRWLGHRAGGRVIDGDDLGTREASPCPPRRAARTPPWPTSRPSSSTRHCVGGPERAVAPRRPHRRPCRPPPATTTTTAPPATTTTTTTTPPSSTGGGTGNAHRGQWPPWGGSGAGSCSNSQSNGHVVQTCP